MKPSLHVLALSPSLPARRVRSADRGHTSARRSRSALLSGLLGALAPWRCAPSAPPPPIRQDALQQDPFLYGAARVRRSDLLDRAERLRTLGW